MPRDAGPCSTRLSHQALFAVTNTRLVGTRQEGSIEAQDQSV